MNFTCTIKYPKDKNFGTIANDKWNGMVGELLRDEADFGELTSSHNKIFEYIFESLDFSVAASLTITSIRNTVIDFAIPIITTPHALFIKNPEDSINLMAYVNPMQWTAWTAVAVFPFTVPIFLYFTTRYPKNFFVYLS